MKKTLHYFTIAFLFFTTYRAQTNVYHPFPASNGIWHQKEGGTSQGQYVILGDTLINAMTWHKVYGEPLQPVVTPSNCAILGAIREDSAKRVFFYNMTTGINSACSVGSVYKLFDFSVDVGDTAKFGGPPAYFYPDMKVTSIDSVFCHDSYRKRYNLEGDTWIEGIGSTRDLFAAIRPITTCGCGGQIVICYRENTITYYIVPPYVDCYNLSMGLEEDKVYSGSINSYPNPFSVQTTLKSVEPLKDATVKIYDSFGKEIRQIKNVSGESIIIQREGLVTGVYFLKIMQNNQVLKTEKLVISEDKF